MRRLPRSVISSDVSDFLRVGERKAVAATGRETHAALPPLPPCGVLLCVQPGPWPPARTQVGACFYSALARESEETPAGEDFVKGGAAPKLTCEPPADLLAWRCELRPPLVKLVKCFARALISAASAFDAALNYQGRTVAWACGQVDHLPHWKEAGAEAQYRMPDELQAQGIVGLCLEVEERESLSFTVSLRSRDLVLHWDRRRKPAVRTFCRPPPPPRGSTAERACTLQPFVAPLQAVATAQLRGALMQSGVEDPPTSDPSSAARARRAAGGHR